MGMDIHIKQAETASANSYLSLQERVRELRRENEAQTRATIASFSRELRARDRRIQIMEDIRSSTSGRWARR